ncbi:14458_t:CDS:2 [Funneliformis caledonium]|uniref:14458_t:CDS:1 n=1 Tax=Funneliformis caledonium TaxID=1117310 RepID=A0A9N9DY54_9GLOM|nr:14458_t:CDS:2 [Funneliformis caledonium]
MPKPKKHHFNKDYSKAIHTNTKTRNLVEYKYTLHCRDSKWRYSSTSRSIKNNSVITETLLASKRKKVIKPLKQNHSSYENTSNDDKSTPTILTDQNLIDFSTEKDDHTLSENSEVDILFEQFTAPDFDNFDSDLEYRYSNMNINFDDSWIVL